MLKTIAIVIIAPLIVTVVAGIAIYHYTKSFSDPLRDFGWKLENISTLSFNEDKYYSLTLTLQNNKDERLDNVVVEVDLDGEVFESLAFASSQGKELENHNVKETSSGIEWNLSHVKSGETILLQLFLKTNEVLSPVFRVYSDQMLATSVVIEENLQFKRVNPFVAVAISSVPSLLLAVFLIFGYTKYRDNLFSSRNNTAFALMHSGRAPEAVSLLKARVLSSGGTVFELSNLAGALSLSGDIETATGFLEAAKVLSNASKESWIISLNGAIIEHASGNSHSASIKLSEFQQKSKRNYNSYVKFSLPMKGILATPHNLPLAS